jgi:hypothetical protein
MPTKIIKATRARNNNGRFHLIHSNTLISTFENEYGIKTGFPPDLTVGFLLENKGFESVTQYVKHYRKRKKL